MGENPRKNGEEQNPEELEKEPIEPQVQPEQPPFNLEGGERLPEVAQTENESLANEEDSTAELEKLADYPKSEKIESKEGVHAGLPPGERAPQDDREEKMQIRTALAETFGEFIDNLRQGKGGEFYATRDNEKMNLLYGKAGGLFKELTGFNLEKGVRQWAKNEVLAQGGKVIKKEDFYKPENTAEFMLKTRMRGWGEGIRKSWNTLSETERKALGSPKAYARKLEADRKALAGRDIDLDKDLYYELLNQGYKPQDFKMVDSYMGFVRRVEVQMPNGAVKKLKIKDFEELASTTKKAVEDRNNERLKPAMDKAYEDGIRHWHQRKIKNAGKIVLGGMLRDVDSEGFKPEVIYSYESFAKITNIDEADARIIGNMDMQTAARELWTPKIMDIEKQIDNEERILAEKIKKVKAVTGELVANPVFKLTAEEKKAVKKYVETGKGKVSNEIPKSLLDNVRDAITALGDAGKRKIKQLLAAKEAIRTQEIKAIAGRTQKLLAEI